MGEGFILEGVKSLYGELQGAESLSTLHPADSTQVICARDFAEESDLVYTTKAAYGDLTTEVSTLTFHSR